MLGASIALDTVKWWRCYHVGSRICSIYLDLFQMLHKISWRIKKPTKCHLLHSLYFLDTQHVSGINMSIFRSLRLLTYLLTPWCIVLLEKLTGLQVVKKFPAFHGTRNFITALTSVRHLSLSWASPIQSTSWRSILILSTHLRLGLPSGNKLGHFNTQASLSNYLTSSYQLQNLQRDPVCSVT